MSEPLTPEEAEDVRERIAWRRETSDDARRLLATLDAVLADLERTIAERDAIAEDEQSWAEAAAQPPQGTRLVLMSEDVMDALARTAEGKRVTWIWGESDEHGWYAPTFTEHNT